ncbi:MAG: T9SS type A sorting domain-containing protein [Winogradskyella sp.]|uniref:T9SS type A sorting domain-containing protein n=1 Tax=Winogradskyella sp. TaxID=1883156 RepID=UPI00385AC02F
MKLKLLLLFTICSMVSIAQSKTATPVSSDGPALSAGTSGSLTVATFNEPVNYDDQIKIYPTVTETLVYFKAANPKLKFTISVYDIYGKQQNIQQDKEAIDLSDLKAGIYIIKFTFKNFSVTKNIVKK